MTIRVTVHILNEEAFVADMESLPDSGAAYIQVTNPRTREGRPVTWSSKGATSLLLPWARITFIEVMIHSEEIYEIEKFYKDGSDSA